MGWCCKSGYITDENFKYKNKTFTVSTNQEIEAQKVVGLRLHGKYQNQM